MKRIGLLSDTHGLIDDKMLNAIAPCDEIWHAGDLGTVELLDHLRSIKPVRAVYGNIDGGALRLDLKKIEQFTVEGVKVFMTHIGGYPNNYDREIKPQLERAKPTLFISGHSHILKVIYDKKLDLLHINPGAVGRHGFHKVRTLVRFVVENGSIKDLEVVELEVR